MADNIFGQRLDGGYLQNVPPNAPRDVQIAVLNDVVNRLNALLKTQILSDGTNKRMLIGYQKDGWGDGKDFGMKISIEGIDVTEATDSQLLFKMDLTTWFWYDPETLKNVAQVGVLPDGVGGIAGAKPGFNVEDAYSG